MSAFTVEFVQPSSLARGQDAETAFDNCWAQLSLEPRSWRSYRLLPADGGLFLKGVRIPLLTRTRQQWRRRWDIHRELGNLRRLQGSGLPVTVPVAWGCESRLGIPLRSFLLLRGCNDAVNLAEFIRQPASQDTRMAAFRAVGRMVAAVHAAGLRHCDLAARNVLVRGAGLHTQAVLVDFARARFVRPGPHDDRLRRNDLYRLTKTALRQGAREEEVRTLLHEAAGPDGQRVFDATRSIRSIDARPLRKLRIQAWRLLGI